MNAIAFNGELFKGYTPVLLAFDFIYRNEFSNIFDFAVVLHFLFHDLESNYYKLPNF